MASQYSILRNYGKYISPYNVDLMMQGMGYMQERIDTNRQAINDYVDYIVNTDIAKPQDREYLQNRLSGIVQDVNDTYRKSNLASDGIARSIQSRLGEALDTRVLNAIAGTREIRDFTEKMEDLKLNHPDQYSAVNEAVAFAPAEAWLTDGQVGTRMNPIHYTPYTDYNAEINKTMKDFVSLNKGRKFTVPETDSSGNPTGRMREVTVDEMSPSQVRMVAMNSLSSNAKAQLQIEGRYMAMTNPGMFDTATVGQFVSRYVAGYDAEERELMARLKGVEANPEAKAALEAALAEVREQRRLVTEEASSFIGDSMDPARAGEFVVRNEFLNGVASRWSYNNSYETYGADDYFFKMRDADLKEREFAWKQRVKDMELALKEREVGLKGSGSGSGSGTGSFGGVPMVSPEQVLNDVTPEELFDKQYLENESRIAVLEDEIINSLSAVDLAGIREGISRDPRRYEGGVTKENIIAYIKANGGATSALLSSREAVDKFDQLMRSVVSRKEWNGVLESEVNYLDQAFDAAAENVVEDVTRNQPYVSGGIDTYVDNGVVNAKDLVNGEYLIGGKAYTGKEALKISALAGLIGENINYVDRSVDNVELMRAYVRSLSRLTGHDISLQDIEDLAKNFTRVDYGLLEADPGELDDKGKMMRILGLNMARSIGPTFRREWSSTYLGQNMERAVRDSKTIYDNRYNEFSRNVPVFTNNKEASDEERAMHAGLQTLFLSKGGNLLRDKMSTIKDYVFYVTDTGDPGVFNLIGRGPGVNNTMSVQITADEAASVGYTVWSRGRDVMSDGYTSAIVPVNFATNTNRAYQRWANDRGLGEFATVENAAEYVIRNFGGYTVPRTDGGDETKRALDRRATRIVNEALRRYNKYEIKAKGVPGGVEVGIYGRGQAKDGRPLTVLEYDTEWADEISRNVDMCPQLYLVQAYIQALNKDAIVKSRDIRQQHQDLSNLLSVFDNNVLRLMEGGDDGQQ